MEFLKYRPRVLFYYRRSFNNFVINYYFSNILLTEILYKMAVLLWSMEGLFRSVTLFRCKCFLLLNPIYRVSQEKCARLQESVPYVKVYRYNPKHLCPKLNGYRDNGQRKVWSSGGSTHCTCQLTA